MTAAIQAVGGVTAVHAAYSGQPVLAWGRWNGTTQLSVWAAAPDMTGARLLYGSSDHYAGSPAVSQDGQAIAFVRWNSHSNLTDAGIFSVDASGAGLTRWTLPSEDYLYGDPLWAPDRSAMFFRRYEVASQSSDFFRVDSPGGPPALVPNTRDAFLAALSPDGRYLAFTTLVEGVMSVSVVRTTGEDLFVLRPGDSQDSYYNPRWSPDGTRIALRHQHAGSPPAFLLVDTSGDENTTVVLDPAEGAEAANWSDDSAQLFYAAPDRDSAGKRTNNLRRIDAQPGATPVHLTDNEALPNGSLEFEPSLGGGAGPAADSTAPVLVPGTTTVGSSAVRLRYSLGGDRADAARFVIRYSEGATAPATVDEGTAAYDGLRRSVSVGGLTPGTEYSFSVFAIDWAGNISEPISETLTTARGSTMTATPSKSSLVYGRSVRVHATLTDTAAGTPLAGRTVELFARPSTSTKWTLVGTDVTAVDGTASAVHKPSRHTSYQWRYPGDDSQGAAVAQTPLVKVATKVTAAFNDSTIKVGQTAKLSGSVAPGHGGQYVYLQRYVGGVWRNETRKRLSSTSRYSFAITPSKKGTRTYRVVKGADADHSKGVSPTRKLAIS